LQGKIHIQGVAAMGGDCSRNGFDSPAWSVASPFATEQKKSKLVHTMAQSLGSVKVAPNQRKISSAIGT
jgi:hypothetical protein